jgi:4-hydroxybutyrate dehydrogenase
LLDSEVSVGFVIVMSDGRKLTFASPKMIPRVAICDPELTLGLPDGLAAMGITEGMIADLVPHAVADLSTLTNPRPADAAAYAALFAAAL